MFDLETNSGACMIGVISDTHGVMRPEALDSLQGSSLIVHAGDIGGPEIIDQLSAIAPLRAVAGNMDWGEWSQHLPPEDVIEIADYSIYVLHDLYRINLDPVAAGFNVVVSGHTHHPAIAYKENVLYLNPGSAGPGRLSHPITVARISINAKQLRPEIVELDGRFRNIL